MSLYTRAATPAHPPRGDCSAVAEYDRTHNLCWEQHSKPSLGWMHPSKDLQQISGIITPFPSDQAPCGSDILQNCSSDCGSGRDFTWGLQYWPTPAATLRRWDRHRHLQLQEETNWGQTDELGFINKVSPVLLHNQKKAWGATVICSPWLSRDIKQSSWPYSRFGDVSQVI